ncbi:hypothetical protein Patl1_30916 [Pistacia atlantica]|uniref:Uncharacterized protein n=1 Tax=Pistacia atlantica TaxID=434234 RepID=A0ACC1A9H6_9ROSI|nr:hypothetical protein Patl1_30916 [Pistacia atlantica]
MLLLQLKKMCKEGAYWGKGIVYIVLSHIKICSVKDFVTFLDKFLAFFILRNEESFNILICATTGTVGGVYVGMEYGAERLRGTKDWKNAMVGGALTGALISAATNKSKDKVVIDAITGGAIATAAEFLSYLT